MYFSPFFPSFDIDYVIRGYQGADSVVTIGKNDSELRHVIQ